MFKALIGDLFASRAQALVNPVDCVGVMGKGVAPEFKKRFPVLFDDYVHRCERKVVKVGEPYLFRDRSGLLVVTFPTKGHWRSTARLRDIDCGLDWLAAHLAEWGVKSLAVPPLGQGKGDLDWAEVGPLIYRRLHAQPINIEAYAPPGTPAAQLTPEFLGASAHARPDGGDGLNANRVVLLEVLRELQAQPQPSPVGRTIFQKICYVVTAMGVPTGFEFRKTSYGPFSGDVKTTLQAFAERNWLNEEQRGRVLALRVGPEYEKDRSRLAGVIQEHQKKIAKTADLFSRVKTTEQADEIVVVLFASREIKHGRPRADVTEHQILDHVVRGRKSWDTQDKRMTLATTIRSLVALGWLRAGNSEGLLVAGAARPTIPSD